MGGPISTRVLGRVRRQVVVGGDGGAEGRRLHVSRNNSRHMVLPCR